MPALPQAHGGRRRSAAAVRRVRAGEADQGVVGDANDRGRSERKEGGTMSDKDKAEKLRRAVEAYRQWREERPGANGYYRYDQLPTFLADAYLAEHPAGAPDWYSPSEIENWLLTRNYCKEIATELAGLIAANYQLAFNKGFSMGQSSPK
jgi:hypothetical protein